MSDTTDSTATSTTARTTQSPVPSDPGPGNLLTKHLTARFVETAGGPDHAFAATLDAYRSGSAKIRRFGAPLRDSVQKPGSQLARTRAQRNRTHRPEPEEPPAWAPLRRVAAQIARDPDVGTRIVLRLTTVCLVSLLLLSLSSPVFVPAGISGILILWGMIALFESAVSGRAFMDPRLGALLVLVGSGNLVVALAALLIG